MHSQEGYSGKFGEVRVLARRACIQTAFRRLFIKATAPSWHVHGLWSGQARGIDLGCTVVVQSNGALHTTHDPRHTATRVSCPSLRTCGLTSCNTYENSIPYADCVNCIPIVSLDTDGAERTSELLLRAMQALYRKKFGSVKHNLQAALILPPRIPHGVGSPLGHPGGETKGCVGKIPKMKFGEVRVSLETFAFLRFKSSGEVRVSQELDGESHAPSLRQSHRPDAPPAALRGRLHRQGPLRQPSPRRRRGEEAQGVWTRHQGRPPHTRGLPLRTLQQVAPGHVLGDAVEG